MASVARLLAIVAIAACAKQPATSDVTGSLVVDGSPVALHACRPGHAEHVFVEVGSAAGALRFGDGTLYWNGGELACTKLERRWGGGVRVDGSAYFRGTLEFACTRGAMTIAGDLRLDCGQITPEERAQLDASGREARDRAAGSDAH